MNSCPNYRSQLAEYAARGGLSPRELAELQAHLATCANCRQELVRLQRVDEALRTWPLESPRRDLTPRVMAVIKAEPLQEEWHWLPRGPWLLALVVSLVLGFMLAGNMAGTMVAPLSASAGAVKVELLLSTAPLHQPLSFAGTELFWAVWCGFFVTIAGGGICLALTSGGHHLDEVSEDLRERLEHLRQTVHL